METDSLSATFAALADPTRRAILARLARGSATVKELSAPFSMSGPAVSKHLRVLERAGLIRQGRDAQFRPCQLQAEPLKAVLDWTEDYRRFWEESFDRLEEYLGELESRAAPSENQRSTAGSGRPRKTQPARAAKPTRRPARRTQGERRRRPASK